MDKYGYKDGFQRESEGKLTPKEIHEDEEKHGRLLWLDHNGRRVRVYYEGDKDGI